MYGWTDHMRHDASRFFEKAMADADGLFAHAHAMLNGTLPLDVGSLLRGHAEGIGSYADVSFFRVRQLADAVAQRLGRVGGDESLFKHDWSLDPAVAEEFCPELAGDLLTPRGNDGLAATELLEAGPNECMDLAWPTSLAGFMRRPRRLPLRAYATDDAVAYVHPFRYQILSRDQTACWETASPRMLLRRSLNATPMVEMSRAVVIIQDRFDFANFCHFLFDALTRVLHYVGHFGYQDELFVFGGIPGRYQELLGRALAEVARIPASSLYFPRFGQVIKGCRKYVWFSDQKELHTHPAQMAHKLSLAALRPVADLVPGVESTARRIYISRGDATRRRIANEGELTAALQARGFVVAQLAGLSVEQQVGLFRNAEVIVAPHGMGLTHIAMGTRLGRVIELFHPSAGTDAYAFVARSAGMEYTHILGTDVPATHSDFSVDVERVLDVLGPEGVALRRANWRQQGNLIPASRSFHGFEGGMPEPVISMTEADFSPMIANQAVRFHVKRPPASNTLVGEWRNIDVAPQTVYVASCWIWLPQHLPADEVSIRIGEWSALEIKFANLMLSHTWQRISFAAVSPKDAKCCGVGLHIIGHADAALVSTCWQLERGLAPSAYVAT